MDLKYQTICTALILCASCEATPRDTARPVDLHQAFIKSINESTEATDDPSADPAVLAIVSAYKSVTIDRAAREKKASFVVLDEEGKAINGVQIFVERAKVSGPLLAPSLRVDSGIVRGTEILDVPWPNLDSTLEMEFRKEGYRTISIDFLNPRGLNRADRADLNRNALELLISGYLHEPAEPAGPMRVIMPTRLLWPPDKEYRSQDDFVPRGWGEERPAKLDLSPAPVVTSDQNRTVALERRGTYALLDRRGNVLAMRRLDRGNLVWLRKKSEEPGTYFIDAGSLAGSSNFASNPDAEPYQWQLVGEPTVYVEPPASAKPDRGKRSTTQPATDSSKKHPSGT